MKKILFSLVALTLVVLLTACGGGENNNDTGNGDNGNETATENNDQTDNEGNDSEETDDGNESASNNGTIDITASNWKFDQEEYTVDAGDVTVQLTNEEGLHGISIEGTDISIEGDGSDSANLEPGEYTIRCSIQCGQGHSDMVATLIVQ
ncbi:cytochrome C oxidase subunit II [Gracilibacillus halophilus YIM-C55.5]|uniref:Cytochrome C oxidase subunit II n=1 Tax=Gracilibacillus halophilus YIM-C55.5 TaxID=1308866 RepID=N4WM31_9BACI|nr:hypothetical protein [Gracilibacillus halophilus]ENH97227.1 cytochrome C oxidase subunit II [Gracilibacillus halophilus YIM-C55.5]